MTRGSFVFVMGAVALSISSAAVGWAASTAQASEQVKATSADVRSPVTGDRFAPVDPLTQQIALEVDHSELAGGAIPKAISIPTPTAGFAGLALVGILLSRRRQLD